jgi:hypothetical protein
MIWVGSIPILIYTLDAAASVLPVTGNLLVTDNSNFLLTDNTKFLLAGG